MARMKRGELSQREQRFEAQAQRRTKKRDKKGRFAKASPVDPKIVAELGKDRRAVEWEPDQVWYLRSFRRKKSPAESPS
jgi:hypothetical protein